jgi:hypothetical protein
MSRRQWRHRALLLPRNLHSDGCDEIVTSTWHSLEKREKGLFLFEKNRRASNGGDAKLH